MVRADYWGDFAEEIMKEFNTIPENLLPYIDWEKWANDLQCDYSQIDFLGDTFYYLNV